MKKILFSLSMLAMMFVGVQLQAQEGKAMKETMVADTPLEAAVQDYYIKMEITDVSSDNEQMMAVADMFKGSVSEIYVKDGNTLTVSDMMGGMVKMKIMINKDEDIDMLMDMMGNKIHVQDTKLNMDKMKAMSEEDNPMDDLEYVYDKEDTKEILGFSCYKVEAYMEDMDDPIFEAYVTEEIKAHAAFAQGVDTGKLNGYPLQLIYGNPTQMQMTFEATDLKKEVNANDMILNTNGYRKMNMSEFMEQMKQMGGGGGFGF